MSTRVLFQYHKIWPYFNVAASLVLHTTKVHSAKNDQIYKLMYNLINMMVIVTLYLGIAKFSFYEDTRAAFILGSVPTRFLIPGNNTSKWSQDPYEHPFLILP